MNLKNYLEDMESFNLDAFSFASEQIHKYLQVLTVWNVIHHNTEVLTLKEELAQEPDTFTACHIITWLKQKIEMTHKGCIILLDKSRRQDTMSHEEDL